MVGVDKEMFEYISLVSSFAYALGNGAQGVGIILVARYVYGFFFTDEFDPGERTIKHAKVGFMLLVVGFCLVSMFSLLSYLPVLERRLLGGGW